MAGTIRVTHDYSPGDTSSNIQVYVRGRPPEDKAEKFDFIDLFGEGGDTTSDVYKKIVIKDPSLNKTGTTRRSDVSFSFDRIFWTKDNNESVFNNMCKKQIDHVLNGYNSCCFAYGQTGSGKTYTMFGSEGGISIEGESRGMIPRSVEYLFTQIGRKSATSDCAMVCSFLEIYCDQIRDLGKAYLVNMGAEAGTSALNHKTSELFEGIAAKRGNPHFAPAFAMKKSESSDKIPGIKDVMAEYEAMNYEIREDTDGQVFVKDLSLIPVSTLEEVKQLIAQGLAVRATHETKMNATSSRSHTVFTVTCVQRDKNTGQSTQGMLNLVDLAGSERLKKSESEGQRLKEALHINTSLTALGKVIVSLDPNSAFSHVPYRDSKLTRILQNSLGGNSYTTVVAAMHPSASYYEECLSTLQFANRCRNVVNNPRVNYVGEDDKDGKIKRLTQEISMLRMKLGGGGVVLGADGHPIPASTLPPGVIADILQKFGIDAAVNADGMLVVDGAVVDVRALDGSGSPTAGGPQAFSLGRARRLNTGISSASLREMEGELKDARVGMKNLRKEKEMLGREFEAQGNKLVRLQTLLKSMEHALEKMSEDKEISLGEQGTQMRKHYEKLLKGVKEASGTLLDRNLQLFNQIPQNLKSFVDGKKKISTLRMVEDAAIIDKYEQQLEVIKESNNAVIANIKLQYQHFLDVKDNQLRSFVGQFNDYREKKSRHLRKVEEELCGLYRHTQELEAVLDDCATGAYPVRMHQGTKGNPTTGIAHLFVPPSLVRDGITETGDGGMVVGAPGKTRAADAATGPASSGTGKRRPQSAGGLILPKGVRPPNATNTANLRSGSENPNHLKLTKRIVKKYAMKEMALQEEKERLYQETLHAAEVGGMFGMEFAGNVQMTDNIRDFIFNTKEAKRRAGSAGMMRPPPVKTERLVRNRPSTAGLSRKGIESVLKKVDNGESAGLHPTVGFADPSDEPLVSDSAGAGASIEGESLEPMGRVESLEVNENFSDGHLVPSFAQVTSANGTVVGVSETSKTVQILAPGDVSPAPVPHPPVPAPTGLEDTSLVKSLRGKVAELQGANQETMLSNTMVVESLANDETLQYILALEEQQRKLSEQNRELNAQLRNSKVANASLTRRLDKVARVTRNAANPNR